MLLHEMETALNDAYNIIRRADTLAEKMASMLVNRLRHVNSSYLLKQLKSELKNFNAKTGTWNDD